VKQLVLY
jgi:hypothetical protein